MQNLGLEELLEKIRKGYPEAHDIILKIARENQERIGEIVIDLLDLSGSEIERFKAKYPCIFLQEEDVERLRQLIANNPEYRDYLRFKEFYTSENEEKLVQHVSKKIYESLSKEDKTTFNRSDLENTLRYIPVMNLGVIEVPSPDQPKSFTDYVKQNISFFRENKEMAARVLVRYFMKKGEMLYNGRLENFLRDTERELKEIGAHEK